MQQNVQKWRPVLEMGCLALLVMAAVRWWHGAAVPCFDAGERVMLPAADLSLDRPQLAWEGTRPSPMSGRTISARPPQPAGPTEQPATGEAVAEAVPRVVPAESAAPAEPSPVAVAISLTASEPPTVDSSRFWDGVIEYGFPRRTVQLVRNEEPIPPPRPWPVARALLEDLDQLHEPPSMSWAAHVKHRLQLLRDLPSLASPQAPPILDELEQLMGQTESLVGQVAHVDEQSQLRRAGYGLQKRIDLWRAVWQAEQPAVRQSAETASTPWPTDAWTRRLQSVSEFLPDHEAGRDWSLFLGITPLQELAGGADRDEAAAIAQFVLQQVREARLSEEQKKFLRSPALRAYLIALQKLATEPLSFTEALHHVEAIESRRGARYADELAAWWNQIRSCSVPAYQHVAQVLDVHYRNANLRLSMTEEFANRFLPASQHARAPVRESLLGAEVEGQSESLTQLRVRLIPDPDEIRVKLEANGSLSSQTRSRRGPVTMFNQNKSRYIVQKLLTLDPGGVRTDRTRAAATAITDLMGLQTDFDKLPVMGSIVRRVARKKHDEKRDFTHRVLGDRIALRVRQRIDAQLAQEMLKAQQRLEDSVLQPLEQMALAPESLAMYTTEDRAVWRGRLAGEEQLAAFTPRPQALANNLLSLQIHESTLNNFFDRLQLEGRTIELRSLIREILDEWELQSVPVPDDIPEGVELIMAEDHPLAIRCDDDRIRLELTVRTLSYERSHWRNFQVIVDYVPVTEGFSCELRRDGIVRIRSLSGQRCVSGNDFVLKAVFTKVFSKQRSLQLVAPALTADERMRDLNVDQLVIHDGWIGLSVGAAPATLVADRPATAGRNSKR